MFRTEKQNRNMKHKVIHPDYSVACATRQRQLCPPLWGFGNATSYGRGSSLELVEGKAMPNHVHMLMSMPPRYGIAMVVGYLKGESAIRIHRELLHVKETLFGRSF
jgi:hypothetical protein